MSFQYIKYYNFRNLADDKVNVDKPVVFLIGQNGQGKTNFLESIYYTCYGSSFRTPRDKHVIKKEVQSCFIESRFSNLQHLDKIVVVKIENDKKEIKVDGKKINDRKALIDNIPCIIFSHDDMVYVNGPPEKKRRFFNQTLCLFDILFIDLLRNYEKILKSRNVLLKTKKIDLISVYDQRLAILGLEICRKREQLITEFNQVLTPLFSLITASIDQLKIKYLSSWKQRQDDDMVLAGLRRSLKKDLSFKTTTSGPHRDSFQYLYNEVDFSNFGSTGQIRLVSLILKITQAIFFLRKSGKKPVLLLDDVLLEIDYPKRKRILENLPEFEQAFFTFLPNEDFLGYSFNDPLKLSIKDGKVTLWNEQEMS